MIYRVVIKSSHGPSVFRAINQKNCKKHPLIWASIENWMNLQTWFLYIFETQLVLILQGKKIGFRSVRVNIFWFPFQETLHSELHQSSKSTSVHQFFGSIKKLRASPSGLLHICTMETIPIQSRILHTVRVLAIITCFWFETTLNY